MLTSHYLLSILPPNTQKIVVAFSGGKDSHVLLHLLSSIVELQSKIIAVYVHHGLQIEADEWELHCKKIAVENGVDFQSVKVSVIKKNRQSQEEVARNARYEAFRPLIGKNDVLLLAQHREDQLETVLLQLFRGAGIQGLSGMPQSIAFGNGLMIRPLLDVSQVVINSYAEQHDLQWIEDPSNKNNEYDRNFLRNQVLPQLKERWPALDKTVSRSARHCANSQSLIKDLSKQILKEVCNTSDKTLDIPLVLKLNKNKQALVIREWFHMLQLRMPSEKTIIRIINEILKARQSANPEIKTNVFSIRRYRDKLFCFKSAEFDRFEHEICWKKEFKQLDFNMGSLMLCDASEGISKSLWSESVVWVKFRKGSEKIKLPGRQGHHSLKKLFQEKAIPPWERKIIPLIYLNGVLAAVADFWISEDFMSDTKDNCVQFHWLKTY